MVARQVGVAIDLPGHGLSDAFDAAPTAEAIFDMLAAAIAGVLAGPIQVLEAVPGFAAVAARLGAVLQPVGTAAADWPDLTPDNAGSHLTRAWAMARTEVAFAPWDAPCAANARAFDPAEYDAFRLHRRALAALRAKHVPEMMALLR